MFAIGETSRRSGVSVEAIRYYEREGIIPKAGRTASGRRMYSDTEVLQLRFIKRCRDLGFPIRVAVALRDLSTARPDACQAVEAMANEHLQDVQSRMLELQRLELALQEIVANCSQGNQSCPMLVELMTSDD
jgi:MerR family mercuric resistance operon transcriptional regulator